MKILIIPDVHSRRFWKKPVEKYISKVDKIVFLGDYCDPYQDEGVEYEWLDTLNNFNEIIELKKNSPDKVILLLGNHDMHYRNKQFDDYARSTRYDSIHSKQLHRLFNGDNYGLFQICYIVENNGKKVIFSHAGITDFWLNKKCKIPYDDNLQDTINNLEFDENGVGKLCVIGRERTWFGSKTGSPLWCDIREFVTDKSIDDNALQIFGHTRLTHGTKVKMKGFVCLDSKTAFILSDKNTIRKV